MYSKPKGKYIKHRDRQRRWSPRSDDEEDEYDGNRDDLLDGRISPEVVVENYGEGNISADTAPKWPKEFEENTKPEADAEVSPSDSSSAVPDSFPERAQKYMVKNNSLKDLTGAKFITVPDPKPSDNAEFDKFKTQKSTDARSFAHMTGSIKSFHRTGSSGFKKDLGASYGKPVARVKGTYRGPSLGSSKNSHLATLRVYPRKRHYATVKAIPRDGTIRTVKGYHLGNNATVRGHNTGHTIRHLKQNAPVWDKPDGTSFRRSTALSERKEYLFNQFSIELDRPEHDAYTPGSALTGRIVLDVKSDVEIRFVELLIVGLATVHMAKTDPNAVKNSQEVLISKRSYVMGTPDGRWNSVITAGQYISKFKFNLPHSLPSTMKYENKEYGFNFEVGYLVKARICDELGSASNRSTHSMNNFVKVLLTRRHPFLVRRQFDIHSIPNAMQPVRYQEFVNLSCLPIFLDSAAVTLSLDRSVFLAGDEIRVKLIAANGTAKKIKSLTCELQLIALSQLKPRQHYNIVQIYEHEPEGMHFNEGSKPFSLFEYLIPTQTHFIPSVLPGVKMLKVSYVIVMTVNFKSCSGKLFLECPIQIGPAAGPLSLSNSNVVPVFNRPKRFPNFSNDTKTVMPPNIQNGTVSPVGQLQQQVSTTYKSKGSLLCCCVDEGDL